MLIPGLVAARTTARTKCTSENHCCTVFQARMVARGRSGANNHWHISFKEKADGELVGNGLGGFSGNLQLIRKFSVHPDSDAPSPHPSCYPTPLSINLLIKIIEIT